MRRAVPPRTVTEILQKYGAQTRAEYEPICKAQGIVWPPKRLAMLAFKEERLLEVWVANHTGAYRRLATYPILAASGRAGPKLREGDLQVPEGFYRLTDLNPNSRFHLSLRINYPNAEDIRHAVVPRDQMGGDIFLHGRNVSVGCLAIGDPAIEKVFCLAAQIPSSQRAIYIAPIDFRRRPASSLQPESTRMRDLYRRLEQRLRAFPVVAQQ
jgi:murein L,D-transpeptidase YafK